MLGVDTTVHLGNGAACSFWHDHWLGPQPLAALFPALHSHCRRPNITVQGAAAGVVPSGAWDLGLHNRLSATAETELLTIHLALQSAMSSPDDKDYQGVGTAMAPFSSALFYEGRMASLPTDLFTPYIWDNGALPRCKHFLWLVHQECLPTAALLS
jgi:hypothetical protein